MVYLSIGELSYQTGCAVETIRYYEKMGLLSPGERTLGQQRRYFKQQYERLLFILHARELGFSLREIKRLVTLSQKQDARCEEIDALLQSQLEAIQHKIRRLQQLEVHLKQSISSCDGTHVKSCQLIESLSKCGPLCQQNHALI